MLHIIKRKAHHRLYDTTEHRYVGPAQLRMFADAGEEIRVVDARTGRDVTRSELPRVLRAKPLPGQLASRIEELVACGVAALVNAVAWIEERFTKHPRRAVRHGGRKA